MNEIRFAGQGFSVVDAALELYHQDAEEGDWNLDIHTDGAIPRLLLSGTIEKGSQELKLAFIDEPSVIVLDGHGGCLTTSDATGRLALVASDGGFRITGALQLAWNSIEPGHSGTRAYVIELDLNARSLAH